MSKSKKTKLKYFRLSEKLDLLIKEEAEIDFRTFADEIIVLTAEALNMRKNGSKKKFNIRDWT